MVTTRNKLEAFNTVLNSVGERSQSTTGGAVGSTVTDCIRAAIEIVCSQAAWSELRSIGNASSWSGQNANLSDYVSRITNVYFTENNVSRIIPFVAVEEFRQWTSQSYTGSCTPLMWTIITPTTVSVNPYPSNAVERAKIEFETINKIPLPSGDSNFFQCSDSLLELILLKAGELLAQRYLEDVNAATLLNNNYTILFKSMIVHQSGTPTGGYNLYRGRRGGRRW